MQVGVFDTAFHHTMQPEAHAYALPYDLYTAQAVRKYGMHGTSYRYLVSKAARHLDKPPEQLNLIVAHLGTPPPRGRPSSCTRSEPKLHAIASAVILRAHHMRFLRRVWKQHVLHSRRQEHRHIHGNDPAGRVRVASQGSRRPLEVLQCTKQPTAGHLCHQHVYSIILAPGRKAANTHQHAR
jgi:hypothetical protein